MVKESINWLLIFVIAVLAFYSLKGLKLGFIRTAFSMFSTIIALIAASVFSPYVSGWIIEHKEAGSVLEYSVEEKNETTLDGESDINWAKLISDFVTEKSTDHLSQQAKNYIADRMSLFLTNMISFICVFIIIRIFLAILCSSLDFVSSIPILNGLNKTAGFLIGLLHGLLNIWVGFAILTIFSQTNTGKILFEYIEQSVFLTVLYSQNILIKIFI
ncbi:CvpA family protein [Velocimicrobium porci]|uniref:CvpA family protein n=1 Tax=Velocimicrobium porci TaxID=2606634 RepID=A0A6L5Y0P6_9FIRM|nr:CvpA family protein [Velocimicrobium porci]MSS64562.1 CvpA family protein [Velocimicrobium porci]